MALRIFQLLQIGDVHFPDQENHAPIADVKDSSFPNNLVDIVAPTAIAVVAKKIQSIIDTENLDAVCFMGDITSKGCIESFGSAVDYIDKSFFVGRAFSRQNVYFTAGNHDLTRNAALELDEQLKFGHFNDRLRLLGLKPFPIGSCTILRKEIHGRPAVDVFVTNSSIGCGEKKYLVGRKAPEIAQNFESLSQEEIFDQTCSLDTPIIRASDLESIVDFCSTSPSAPIAFVVAHHNVLPQSTPRIDFYTDLLNAGAVRDALFALQKPTIYLHGHIHAEITESIYRGNDGVPVVFVSAPLMRDGFNLIQVAFNGDSFPLGARIKQFRRKGALLEVEEKQLNIMSRSDSIECLSEAAGGVLKWVKAGESFTEGDAIRSMVGLLPEDVVGAVHELEWAGLLRAESSPLRPGHRKYWRKK